MYDIKRRQEFSTITVRKLIEELSVYPQNAIVNIIGEEHFYIHVEKDDTVLCLDDNSMDEEYEDKGSF
jgi:hypothetical protein